MSKDFLSDLGVDVELTSEGMGQDEAAKARLRAIGKELMGKQIAAGQEYVGSFAFHLVMEKDTLLKEKYSMASITQMALNDDVSESMAALAFNNGFIALRKYFNPGAGTGRRGDKR